MRVPSNLITPPDFGLYQLTINQAGLLVAANLFFEGHIDSEELEAAIENENTPERRCWLSPVWAKFLGEYAKEYSTSLTLFVEKGLIEASFKARGIKGLLDPEKSYIKLCEIEKWCEATNLPFYGDVIAEFFETEGSLAEQLDRDVKVQREFGPTHYKNNNHEIDTLSHEELLSEHKKLLIQLKGLEERELERRPLGKRGLIAEGKEVSPRKSRSYLSIIHALASMLEKQDTIDIYQHYKFGNQIEAQLRELNIAQHPKSQTIGDILKSAYGNK